MTDRNITIKKAVIINAASRYLYIILAVVVNAILARIISPEDFGIMAIVTVFSTFFSTLSDFGLSTAIIQNKSLNRREIEDVFSFSLYISLILAIIMIAISYPISIFYNEIRLIKIGQLLSISLFFNSLSAVPNGLLCREKRFLEMSIRNVTVYISCAIIAIILALNGAGIYSLVAQTILIAIVTFIWNCVISKIILHIKFRLGSIKKIAGYSGFQYAFSMLNYFSRNLDNLLIGKYIGTVPLAYYSKAYGLMLYPVNNITGVITPVLHPILSDHQNNKEYIYIQYIKIIKIISLISIYIEVICFFNSSEIVNIVLGQTWAESSVCFKILSIAIMTQMITATTGAIFQSLGETRLLFIVGFINVAITVVGISLGIVFGRTITIVAMFVSGSYLFHFFISFFVMMHFGFFKSFLAFLSELKKEILILVMIFIFGILFINKLHFQTVIISFLAKIVFFTVVFVILNITTGEYVYFLELFGKNDGKKKKAK